MEKEKQIANNLIEVSEMIASGHFADIAPAIQELIRLHPDWVDERLEAEISIIEKQIEYKMQLRDWDYYRMMKLVYQYCLKLYGTDEICCSDMVKGYENSDKRIVDDMPDKDVIWWCWLQGLDQAPEVVKACYRSLERLGKKIVVITENNMMDYVSFPNWIIEGWKVGRIDRTHFSDLIRLELLTSRGGTWIDSTVFCTDANKILDVLQHTYLFCFGSVMKDSVSECMRYDNWFLHCSKPSRILNETKNMLYAYWKQEKELKHYFLFQLIFMIACERNPEERRGIPLYSNEPAHILQLEMYEQFSQQRWDQICDMTGIHKLTYKIDPSKEVNGTMLDHVLKFGIN